MEATTSCPHCFKLTSTKVGNRSVQAAAQTMGYQLRIFIICPHCSKRFTQVIELRLAAVGMPQKAESDATVDELP